MSKNTPLNPFLLPCPACGGNGIFYLQNKEGRYFIPCEKCGMQGPQEDIPYYAAESWNGLPRKLPWTTETPKKGGNYWWKCEQQSSGEPQMVNVRITEGRFHFFFHNSEGPCLHACEQCRWAGPIPMPKEHTNV